MESVHADDRVSMVEKWKKCVRSGETFEIEYRLHDATLGYRWYLDRAVPLRDNNGVIQQWFGTCTDIEEQKVYQQTLEKQIKERTKNLADPKPAGPPPPGLPLWASPLTVLLVAPTQSELPIAISACRSSLREKPSESF